MITPDPDAKFFTNQPERDLYTRFAKILSDGTRFFDVLVGYFRSSGFYKLCDSLTDVQEIRILVGLNVDKTTRELTTYTSKQKQDDFADALIHEFNNSPVTYQVEQGAKKFVEWLKSGKLKMKMYPKSKLHAKVYIMRREQGKTDSVITGSSNFSEAGFIENLEFNVELQDESDVKFALNSFEELWAQGTDISQIYIETAEQRTWLRGDITPYEVYLKTLQEFFDQELMPENESFSPNDLPANFMRLQYQIDAVIQAKRMLETYGGVFISDVVGLGKTYICAMLAKILPQGKKLVICPPVLVEYWQEVMRDFDVAAKVVSLGKLDSIVNDKTEYKYVFVDEAHRFRNSGTKGYIQLHQICCGRKVILISATPINNYSSDIENQIYLFQPRYAGNIPGVKNLAEFFAKLNGKIKNLQDDALLAQLKANSQEIRSKILRHIMIRRTRSEIAKFYHADMTRQGLTFPKAGEPEKIIYSFDDQINEIFDATIIAIGAFTYSRYKPFVYLKNPGKFAALRTSQENMGGFMKSLLVKRLESSFHAFKKTLGRFIKSYERFIKMYNEGKIFICENLDFDKLFESGLTDEAIIARIEDKGGYVFESDEFDPKFIIDLNKDLSTMQYLQNLWSSVKTDPKLEKFLEELRANPKFSPAKKIIFTESAETAKYLESILRRLYRDRVISFSGMSSKALRDKIEASFNPKNFDPDNDPYDILITTDILAEGVNLHRANIIVNYDLPWNPTRIMQRVGRINRVGTQHTNIYVFNFFPTAQSSAQLPLTERILEKLQLFNTTLGGDYKYLGDMEGKVSPQNLFEQISADIDSFDGEADGELKYIELIRNVRDNDPKLYERIKNLPAMSKTGRISHAVKNDSTLTFIRKGALKEFFMDAQQITFQEAMTHLECNPSEQAVSVDSTYFTQFKANNTAFDDSLARTESTATKRSALSQSENKLIDCLSAIDNEPTLSDEQHKIISRLLNACNIGTIPKSIIKAALNSMKTANDAHEALSFVRVNVPEKYLLTAKELAAGQGVLKLVVLSCYMKKE